MTYPGEHDGILSLGWTELHLLVRSLAEQLRAHPIEWDRIVTVTRGGLPIATILSHLLDVRVIQTVQVIQYHSDAQGDMVVRSQNALPAPWGDSGDPERTLIVDDILDTGRTMEFLIEKYPQAAHCVLVRKAKTLKRGSVSALTVNADTWVRFPWEVE